MIRVPLQQLCKQALAQVRHADLLVVTKVDRAQPGPMLEALAAERPQAAVALSAQGSLAWSQVQALLADAGPRRFDDPFPHTAHHDPHDHHDHHHAAEARFLPCPAGLDREGLLQWALNQRPAGLQRLKGVLQSADGRLFMAQWSLGDEAVSLVGFEGPVPRLGLTCIA